MTDLKLEQKRSLSRLEAADQLTALAEALRKGGEAEMELGFGSLKLRIPDDLESEVEIEVEDGEIELEIELKWSTGRPRSAPSQSPPARKPKSTPAEPAPPTGTTKPRTRTTKRAAKKAT